MSEFRIIEDIIAELRKRDREGVRASRPYPTAEEYVSCLTTDYRSDERRMADLRRDLADLDGSWVSP